MRRVEATALHEAFYQDAVSALGDICKRRPEIRNVEIIAILGRMSGYCIAMCKPEERDLARAMAIENLDRALAELSQQ